MVITDEILNKVVLNAISKVLNEKIEVTPEMLRKGARMNATTPNSVAVRKTSTEEILPVKMNKYTNFKKSLSRIIMKKYKNGMFLLPQIEHNNHDKCIRQFNIIKQELISNGWKIFSSEDSKLDKKVFYGFNTNNKTIIEFYIETANINTVDRFFDLEPVERYLENNNINTAIFQFPDKAIKRMRFKKPKHDIVHTNWDWIRYGTPRPFRQEPKYT